MSLLHKPDHQRTLRGNIHKAPATSQTTNQELMSCPQSLFVSVSPGPPACDQQSPRTVCQPTSQQPILSVWNQRKKTWTECGPEPGSERSLWKALNPSPWSNSPKNSRIIWKTNSHGGVQGTVKKERIFPVILPSP